MPQLKIIKENKEAIYPVTVLQGVCDTTNNQKLSEILNEIKKSNQALTEQISSLENRISAIEQKQILNVTYKVNTASK